ncbi:hypothetical protein MMAD_55080 (plasmid) [Mycolicibacterium madagascariense]|uniref:Uncharacterized protein n=1 Tax=Mycolicibacterium madagascariense TaxID=212765 RepID=A0A7I7XQ20_9MYCO|nr:hypothetical protein [Mycolicibacterium madagascariense]BBZ31213.1 hypothetical protein MMAD_55080 [Mycolicibacterium madagascariense]
MDIESFWDLANCAADLLPDAPDTDDTLGWMSWRELVWETARRLGALGQHLGVDLRMLGVDDGVDSSAASVSADQLVAMGMMLHRDSLDHADASSAPPRG